MEELESSSLYKELGLKIAITRKELNLTQEELAKKLEIQQSTLACYESGKRKPSIALIIKISEVLNVYIEDLLPIEQDKKKRGPKSKLEKELDKIRQLPEEKIKAFLHLLEVINRK